MIESPKLVHFLEVAHQKSFRQAARKLNMSQPALSRSIKRLEEQLEAQLFHRTTKKVALTVFGEALLPKATSIVNSLGDAHQEIEELRGLEAGEFSVGYGPIYSALLAAPTIGIFCTQHPNVKIYTEIGRFTDLIERLKNGQIDLFIGETSTFTPTHKYRIVPLKNRKAVYCCRSSHPIFESRSINFELVTEYPLVSCQLPYRLLPNVHRSGDQIHTDKNTFIYSNIVCDSFLISKQIAIRSDAICIIPEDFITAEVACGELRILDFKHKQISSQSGIVHLAERDPAPAVKKYIEIVKELDEQL